MSTGAYSLRHVCCETFIKRKRTERNREAPTWICPIETLVLLPFGSLTVNGIRNEYAPCHHYFVIWQSVPDLLVGETDPAKKEWRWTEQADRCSWRPTANRTGSWRPGSPLTTENRFSPAPLPLTCPSLRPPAPNPRPRGKRLLSPWRASDLGGQALAPVPAQQARA